jgi:DNA-binding CsgD family transcriptional regulator
MFNEMNEQDKIEYRGKTVTKREKECINGLIDGLTAKEIAKILNISHRTVEKYIENIKFKLECKNLKQLIAVAIYSLQRCQSDGQIIE